MNHPEDADQTGSVRLHFDRRMRQEFRGMQPSSDCGLLLFRELDEVRGLLDAAGGLLRGTRSAFFWSGFFGNRSSVDWRDVRM